MTNLFSQPLLKFSYFDPQSDSVHGVVLRRYQGKEWAVHTFDFEEDNTHNGSYIQGTFKVAACVFYNRVRETQNKVEEMYK